VPTLEESFNNARIVIEGYKTPPSWVIDARKKNIEKRALISGIDFKEELINRIEHVENTQRAEAREKYSRSIVDLFERILRPVDNVYSSSGGSKFYNISSESEREELLLSLKDIRGCKSLEQWLECFWMKEAYHEDPNGLIFLEYSENSNPYPTYKSIQDIQFYISNGQKLEILLFAPVNRGDGNQIWRYVDESNDLTILQDGDTLSIINELSFEHPFGIVPALINSDLEKAGTEVRDSPIEKIVEISKEYAANQSVKSIYKFIAGFPHRWRLVSGCPTCEGTGKIGDDDCAACDGKGILIDKDVTDDTLITVPEEGEPVTVPNVSGWISPDLNTWEKYTEELDFLEQSMNWTHWGAMIDTKKARTATEVVTDVQPVIKRLNKYGDVAEKMEQFFTDLIYRFQNPETEDNISSISYGRNYIIESTDTIRQRYEEARKNSDNNTILDQLFKEYLTAKYRSDAEMLSIMLKKSNIEPYIHISLEECSNIFGRDEARKKVLFEDWWKTLNKPDIMNKNSQELKTQFDMWFQENNTNLNTEENE